MFFRPLSKALCVVFYSKDFLGCIDFDCLGKFGLFVLICSIGYFILQFFDNE